MKNMRAKCKKGKIRLKKEIKICNKDKMKSIIKIQDHNKIIWKMKNLKILYQSKSLWINLVIMLKTKTNFLRFYRSWWVSKPKGTGWKRNSLKNNFKFLKKNHQISLNQINNTVKIIWKIIDIQIEKWFSFSLHLFIEIYKSISISAILIFITLKYLFVILNFFTLKPMKYLLKNNIYSFVYRDKV